jgi:hypothetical protein
VPGTLEHVIRLNIEGTAGFRCELSPYKPLAYPLKVQNEVDDYAKTPKTWCPNLRARGPPSFCYFEHEWCSVSHDAKALL